MVRLSAPPEGWAFVPYGAKSGDKVTFTGLGNQLHETKVPIGMQPGMTFPIYGPHVMLRVPDGAIPGDQLLFMIPAGFGSDGSRIFQEKMAVVPENMTTGQYFAATLEPEVVKETEVSI